MEELIQEYLKTKNPDTLHDIRVLARKTLANLALESKTDLFLKKLMRLSSIIRDSDVMMQICRYKKIKNYLLKQKKENLKEFIRFLQNYHPKIVESKTKKTTIKKCQKICKYNFLKSDDRKLHKIRIKVKKCRYSLNIKELKTLQTLLGEAHDYYNCIKLLKKFGFNTKKAKKIKLSFVKKANKEKEKICKLMQTQ